MARQPGNGPANCWRGNRDAVDANGNCLRLVWQTLTFASRCNRYAGRGTIKAEGLANGPMGFVIGVVAWSSKNARRKTAIRRIATVVTIQADWHFKDFTAHFGKENVRKIQIHVGEGFSEKAIAVYPGTPEELNVFLTEDGDTIDYIVIEGNQTKWKTADAVTLGDPIEKIQAVNDKPFLLTGFAWDYPGRVTSWEGAKLPEELKLGFENTREIPWDTFTQVMGDGEFPSDHAVFGQMGLVVNRIWVDLKQ